MPDSLVRAYTAHLITTFNYTKSCFKSKIYESPKLGIEIGEFRDIIQSTVEGYSGDIVPISGLLWSMINGNPIDMIREINVW